MWHPRRRQSSRHTAQTARTLIELRQRDDGSWVATQRDVDVEGTGETGALAAMDYCRQIADGRHLAERTPPSGEGV